MTDPNDDLADVLAPGRGQTSPALREALLGKTEKRLSRGRWIRRAARAGAIGTVFLAGGLASWLTRPVPEPLAQPAPEVIYVPVLVPVPVPEQSPALPVATSLAAPEAELRAEQAIDPPESARLYKLAGDAFLRDQEYANATRCYRLFLARAGDVGLLTDADDSWLLTSLKNAAFKEKTNATKTVD